MATAPALVASSATSTDPMSKLNAVADNQLCKKDVHLSMFQDGAIPLEWLTPEFKYRCQGSKSETVDQNGNQKQDGNPLDGMWELILKVSEPCDDILTSLQVGFMQRSLLRCYKSRVEIRVTNSKNTCHLVQQRPVVPSDDKNSQNEFNHNDPRSEKVVPEGDPIVPIKNSLVKNPEEDQLYFHVKQYFPMNTVKEIRLPECGSLQHTESDTMQTWKIWSLYHDGILYQKRESELGVMYDVRCLFHRHPNPEADSMLKENVQLPLQLLRITFIDPQGHKFVANRWFQRTDNSSSPP